MQIHFLIFFGTQKSELEGVWAAVPEETLETEAGGRSRENSRLLALRYISLAKARPVSVELTLASSGSTSQPPLPTRLFLPLCGSVLGVIRANFPFSKCNCVKVWAPYARTETLWSGVPLRMNGWSVDRTSVDRADLIETQSKKQTSNTFSSCYELLF